MSKHFQDEFGLEFCPLAPSLPKNPKMTALIHVDDVMIFGGKDYVLNHFLPKVKEMLNISVNIVEKPGDKISFLMRSYLRVSDGLVVMPGSYINNRLELYESNFGPVQAQKVPADGSIQVEDESQELDARTSSIYKSLIGMLIYLSIPFPRENGCWLCDKGAGVKDGEASNSCLSKIEETAGLPEGHSRLCMQAYNS